MTIDDELLIELFKPNVDGKVGENALIVKIVGTFRIKYYLEEDAIGVMPFQGRGTPDITIKFIDSTDEVAIELENDYNWDFGESLRQLKRYQLLFKDIRILIPEKFERFAPLYKNEGFRVYLWKAKRKWECQRCGKISVNESRVPPKCEACNHNSRNDFDLVGLENTEIREFS